MDAIIKEKKNIEYSIVIVNQILQIAPGSEAFASILNQSLNFEEHIQIIFLEETPFLDISDAWKEFIEKYPDNVEYIETADIHSFNSQMLTKHIKGNYFIFDWDENKYSFDAFEIMSYFIEEHEEETKIFYFNPISYIENTSKLYNNQAKEGVFSLFRESNMLRLDGGSVLLDKSILEIDAIKNITVSDYYFQTIYMIACAQTTAVGACFGAVCEFTKDYAEFKYAVLVSKNNLDSYEIDIFDSFHKKVLNAVNEKMDFLPLFFQNYLCIELGIRTFPKRKGEYVELAEEEIVKIEEKIKEILTYIDDDTILNCKVGFSENKANLLRLKHGYYPEISADEKNVILHYGNTVLQPMADMAFNLDFMSIEDNHLYLEGQFLYFGLSNEYDDEIKIGAFINGSVGHIFECQKREIGGKYTIGGREVQKCLWFKTKIYLSRLVSDYEIEFYVDFKGAKVVKKINNVSKFFPIEPKFDKSYYYADNRMAYLKSDKLFVSYATGEDLKNAETEFCNQIELLEENGKEACVIRRLYSAVKELKQRPIWLCANRITGRGNNGEVFLDYVRKNHPEIEIYFILDENCEDYNSCIEEGINVIKAGSMEHELLFMLCDFNIASQFVQGLRNPFGDDFIYFRDFKSREKFVYLQHGVIKDDMSWINQKRINNYYGHIVSAKAEYDSLENGIDFDEKNLWLTGLARFDKLYHDEQKVVCFSPTWRQWLMNPINADGTRTPNMKAFKNSSCYCFYQSILNNERLLESAEKNGYRIWFCDHPFLRDFDSDIYNFDSRVEIVNDMSSDELNAKTNLMITDYSSSVFDFAYLRKPIVYAQFDKEIFFKNHSFVGEGYFDYERDGFGEVEYDIDSTVDRIIEYMEAGCELKDKYRTRIDEFFEFSDSNNCERIYNHIIHSPAYKKYFAESTDETIFERTDINKLAQMISERDNTISPQEILIHMNDPEWQINKEVEIAEEVEVTENINNYESINFVTYVPERFSNGDLGLKAIWWCVKGWLRYKFKKGKG